MQEKITMFSIKNDKNLASNGCRSDVMGHIAPLVGGQWAQPGVSSMYQRIVRNGYRIIYLSARAIGQSSTTKDYLRSVNIDGHPLPDGPIFLTPSSLLQAFTK